MELKKFHNKIILVILTLIVISVSAFFAEDIAHKGGVHRKICEVSYAAESVKRTPSGPFFYPAPEQEASDIFQNLSVKYPFTFIVYGDSREPAGNEKDVLIAQIIKEKPAFVIHIGDMVLNGEEHQWKIFDFLEGKIINSGIPFYPALGNHEYYARDGHYSPNPEEQLRHYFNRFKYIENKRWYSFKYGNNLFLILDTNTDYSPESYQYKWLMSKLKEESPTFLFIAFHHPPYTRDVNKSNRGSEKLLAGIFESYSDKKIIKADIVFSGDVHNYERYQYNGINYVVSGGGGAPQHTVNREPDDFYNKVDKVFHYCKITVSNSKAIFEMIRLDIDTGKWVIADTFTIINK
jgi:predicted phosphodiesterase